MTEEDINGRILVRTPVSTPLIFGPAFTKLCSSCIVTIAHKLESTIPAGAIETYDPDNEVYMMTYKTDKMRRIFPQLKLKSKEETVKDSLAQFRRRGMWQL